MKLIQVKGNTWCIEAHQLIPVYKVDDSRCILLDTGIVYSRAKIENLLAEAGLTPVGIICTHTHFDHFGNAAYFREKYGIPVALPVGEAELCSSIAAVKSHLFVFPIGQIRADKKLAAIPCTIDRPIMYDETQIDFCGVKFGIVRTPGHGLDHINIITPDRVCYAGDSLMCGHNLKVSKLPYAFDMQQSLDTMEALRHTDCDLMILSHCGIEAAPFDKLCDDNIRAMRESIRIVSELVDRPMSTDEVYAAVREKFGIVVDEPEKAQSLERFLRPYLEYIVDIGTHEYTVRDGTLCYAPINI